MSSTPTAERGKKRRTGALSTTNTPDHPQTPFNFNFATQTSVNSPLIEESFRPQMTSLGLEAIPVPLPTNEPDPDTTISEANTSLNTSQTRTVSSLKDRIIAANERGPKINTNSTVSKDPIDKYTKGGAMPNVYYSHPTPALDFIDIDQVGDWENLPDKKLLAHPFGHEVQSIEFHQEIKANLFAAVVEITQSDTVGICSPRPCASLAGTPTVFLIYNISEPHRQLLLKREVWSAKNFTFRATSLDPVSPDYLFGITDITTESTTEVKNVVRKVWNSQTTTNFLESMTDTLPDENKTETRLNLDNFSKSMRVEKMDTRKLGGAATPAFNVLADGKLINNDGLWCSLRNFLAIQPYALQFQDPSPAGMDLHRCSICHGIDHPRGLCPFPHVPGWNGPFREFPDTNLKQGDNRDGGRYRQSNFKRRNVPNYR